MPKLNPIAGLFFWLIAAFALIWTGPIFYPAADGTVTLAALLWKLFAAAIALLVNLALLRRSPTASVLGLRPGGRTVGLLVLGVLCGLGLVGLWISIFRVLVPFHLERGKIGNLDLMFSAGTYLFGALLEELSFRGHALVRLRERYSTLAAVMMVSLAFGILHLPGMTGWEAIKIIALTGASSLLFCMAYLLSGSLWTAVGLHAGMNFMLHIVLGIGGRHGPSLLRPVYTQSLTPTYDAAFWTLTFVQLVFVASLLLIWRRPPALLAANAASPRAAQ